MKKRLLSSPGAFIAVVCLAWIVAISATSCGSSSTCSPANCDGCCTADGKCEPGSFPQACGASGGLCQVCDATNSRCTAAVCVPFTTTQPGTDSGTQTDGGNTDGGVTDGGSVDGGGGDAGQPDGGGSDGGTDGGATDAGSDAGVAVYTIAQLRTLNPTGQHVRVEDVVVQDVSYSLLGSLGDYRAEFWVVHVTNPKQGLWVEKFFTDTPTTYQPQVGDRVTLDGWFGNLPAHDDRKGYRQALRNEFALGGQGKLDITLLGSLPRPVNPPVSPGAFGNAAGGAAKPNPDYAGGRVHIAGPLTLTNPSPTALQRMNFGTVTGYNGFEVSGGILVNNYKTFGSSGCDWRAIAADGGTVIFPNGIRGVWDTYTHAPCVDGGTSSCTRANGSVPGTSNDYTYVLYPQDCTNDLPGVAQ